VRPLVWNGTPTGDWNTSTANWLYLGSPTAYALSDFVTFDDTANGTTTVNLTTSLTPGALTVSNITRPYTFNGSGTLGGAVALVKNGAGQLTLANSGVNTFSNGVSIQGGTLQLSGSANRLPASSIVTLADVSNARLDLNNLNQTLQSLYGGGYNGGNLSLGSGNLTDSGGGTYGGVISGSGQLVKTNFFTGGTLTLTNANTYSGGTIIGGYTNNTTLAVANQTGSGTGSGFVRVLTNGTFVLGNGGPGGSVAAGVITNYGIVRLNRADDFTFTNNIVGPGAFQKYNTNTAVLPGVNGYSGQTTIDAGALRISNAGALGSGTNFISNDATASLQLTGGITLLNTLRVDSKPGAAAAGVANVLNLSGNNTLAGPIGLRQNGATGWIFESAAGHLLISGTHTPLATSETSQTTTRTLWLRGDATAEWRSGIVDSVDSIRNLRLLMTGPGTWTLSGANTYTGPTTISNGTLLVNGSLAASSAVTVEGGILGGSGLIGGPVTVNAAGTLAPGSSPATLTINNSLTLNGTTIMEVSDYGSDKVAGIGTLTLGGTLQVVVNGTLKGWEVFKLFSATNYSGDFAYALPDISPLSWDTTSVPVDGTLKVIGGSAPPPTIEPVTVSGTNLVVSVLTAPVGHYVLQSTTNLTPTVVWRNESTNAGTGGTLTNSVPIDPKKPQKFVRFWVY
jgi:fibronectin-binding autotransporter adhesin